MSLFCAAKAGDAAGVSFLITANNSVNVQNEKKSTPLHAAALHGHLEIVVLLISANADVEAKQEGDLTPLHFAAKNGHTDVVQSLISSGADVTSQGAGDIQPLHLAIIQKHSKVVELLLTHKADVHAKFSRGSVMDLAKKYGSVEIREMIRHHTRPEKKKRGISYLDLEVEDSHDVDWLIEKAKDFSGSLQEARVLRSALLSKLENHDSRFKELRKVYWKMYTLCLNFSFEAPDEDETDSEDSGFGEYETSAVTSEEIEKESSEQSEEQQSFLKAVLRQASTSPHPSPKKSPRISPWPSPKSHASEKSVDVSPLPSPQSSPSVRPFPGKQRPSSPPGGPAWKDSKLPQPPSPPKYCKTCMRDVRGNFEKHIEGNRHRTLFALTELIRDQGCSHILDKQSSIPLHEQKIAVEVFCEQTKQWEPGIIADVVSNEQLLINFKTPYRSYSLRINPSDPPKWLRIKKSKKLQPGKRKFRIRPVRSPLKKALESSV